MVERSFADAVFAVTYSPSGKGVDAYAPSGLLATGISGVCKSPDGVVAQGSADSESGECIGVYGETGRSDGYDGYFYNDKGYAGYFVSNVHINGTLSKAGGGFKIDHPLNPQNKYLCHDRWAEQNRIPVEQDKRQKRRGEYLHPELYGQPRDIGLRFRSQTLRDSVKEIYAAKAQRRRKSKGSLSGANNSALSTGAK